VIIAFCLWRDVRNPGQACLHFKKNRVRLSRDALLRETGRGSDFLPAFSVQGIEEGQEILPGLVVQIKWRKPSIQMRVWQPSLGVDVENLSERLDAPIMHVGAATGQITQRRHFELPRVATLLGDRFPSKIGLGLVRTNLLKCLLVSPQ
jgi:hypothetical protein